MAKQTEGPAAGAGELTREALERQSDVVASLLTHQVAVEMFTEGRLLQPGDLVDATDWTNRDLLAQSGTIVPVIVSEPARTKGEILRRLRNLATIDERERAASAELAKAQSERDGHEKRLTALRAKVAELAELERAVAALDKTIAASRHALEEDLPSKREREAGRQRMALLRLACLTGAAPSAAESAPKGAA